jgi:hypothetical protein
MRGHPIANTIYEQMGGRKFTAMTGATLTTTHQALHIVIPRAKNGITHIRITLNGMDTYDVVFYALKRLSIRVVSEVNDVSADQLQDIFERETSLYVTLNDR